MIAKSKHTPKKVAQLKKSFLNDVATVAEMEEIHPNSF